MIIITGGAGFIGSNLIQALNDEGREDIVVVDDLTDGKQFVNLSAGRFHDYLDKDDFLRRIKSGEFDTDNIDVIFHQGACSTTTEWDGKYMMENNYEYSKVLLHFTMRHNIPFIYASSAAVYGGNQTFLERPEFEAPLNVYGYSKLLFDNYVRRVKPKNQVVGLRYFNVYGPHEQHKGSMASVAFHFNQQCLANGAVNLFEGCDGYANGEQQRDFVFVKDIVAVNTWFMKNLTVSGIFNVGTGRSQTFNDVANAVLAFHGNKGEKRYIPFPEHLKGAYQSFTQADLTALRDVGCDVVFKTVEQAVPAYLDAML